jgi:hypothetical protein
MKKPDYDAMDLARAVSNAARELEFFHKSLGETSALDVGTRVYLVTIDGEYSGTVRRDWQPEKSWPFSKVLVELDYKPDLPVELHRSLFRVFTVLDHLSQV